MYISVTIEEKNSVSVSQVMLIDTLVQVLLFKLLLIFAYSADISIDY